MASWEAFAEEVLTAAVEAGGSWWFAVLDAAPASDVSPSVIAEIPPVELPRNGVTWVVDGRVAYPVDPIALDTSGLSGDVTPQGWCLFDDMALTLPRIAGRLTDVIVTPGSVLHVPAAAVTIRFPADVAATL